MNDATSSAKAIVRSYLDAFETADPAAIAAHVREDFVNEHTAALGAGCVGRAVYEDRLAGFLASMPGLTYDIDALVADGDTVAVFYTMRGSYRGEQDFEVKGVQRLVVRDRLIASRTDYWDSAVFLAQVDAEAAAVLAGIGLA
ncbi:MAG: nuclear transport factor 2 family protein [Acidimicrobiales bacterium]